jgi:signal transduction histidine kinase
MAFRHLNLGASDGLTLTVMRDSDEALTSIRANFVRLVVVGAMVFLLAMGLVLFAARRISTTEEEIRLLNAHLEARVEERTQALARSNQSLTETLQRLEHTQEELVESEKLASLGALVAGVAHELNTPIGNALMAASTLSDEARVFADSAKSGMTRSAFDAHLVTTHTGTEMIMTNISRAAELINGFKQLAVDRTSAQRREFNLGGELADIRVAMGPTLRAHPVVLTVGQGVDAIVMDSYPGALSSIIINLINNSILHGFEGRSAGTITIDAKLADAGHVEILFADDGNGMTDDVRKHVFEPFFTTKLGRGGSGLGMHIVYNSVTKLLGGRIELDSAPGQGTRYRLLLPVRPR